MDDRELYRMAKKAMGYSFSPFSRFKVGAALLAKDGRVFTGCNVENSSYPAAICAERTACVKAVSEGVTEFDTIAVVSQEGAVTPCGICRQFLREFGPEMRVIVGKKGGPTATATLAELLPHSFGPEDLSC